MAMLKLKGSNLLRQVLKTHKNAPSEPRTCSQANDRCDEMPSHHKVIHMKEAKGDTIIIVEVVERATIKNIKAFALKGKIMLVIHRNASSNPRIR